MQENLYANNILDSCKTCRGEILPFVTISKIKISFWGFKGASGSIRKPTRFIRLFGNPSLNHGYGKDISIFFLYFLSSKENVRDFVTPQYDGHFAQIRF